MEENKNVQAKPEKMSYEELENVARQLSQQNERMYQQIQQMNMNNAFKRLDYLFKVVEFKAAFPEDFVKATVDEVVTMITIKEDTKEVAEETTKKEDE